MNGRDKMTDVKDWKEGSRPTSFTESEQVLPLLLTILVSVLVGILGAGLMLSAGYGVIAAVSCYVFIGALVSFLLPLAFRKLVALRTGSNREEFRQSGVIGELDELDQRFLREFEWLVDNTCLGLHEGARVMFVAGETNEARDIRNLFTEQAGFYVRDSRNLQDATSIILDAPERWDLLCLDLDAFGGAMDIDIVVQQLLSFRDAASGVPVMLMSRSFSTDNFNPLLRPAIADGCLRIPTADSRVLRALKDACISNLIWQSCHETSKLRCSSHVLMS